MRRWIEIAAVAALAAVLTHPTTAAASTAADGVNVRYKIQPILQLAITPNYASGSGAIQANFGGTQGTLYAVSGATVDFGNVYQGGTYLYRYAAKVAIQSNTPFNLYGEGSADLTGTSGSATGSTLPLKQTLYWLASTDGITADSNTGYSPSTPFAATGQAGASYNSPTIAYSSYPSPIYAGNGTQTLFYDYQMRVPGIASTGQYQVYVVYTAVAQ